jgi:hypothetical protein
MEVTIPTRTEPMKTAGKKRHRESGATDLSPTSTGRQPEMLSCRIAFDDGSPQYLSGEDE